MVTGWSDCSVRYNACSARNDRSLRGGALKNVGSLTEVKSSRFLRGIEQNVHRKPLEPVQIALSFADGLARVVTGAGLLRARCVSV